MARLGANIKRARKNRNLTQQQLAQRIGVRLRGLQGYEAGDTDIPISRLLKLQEALECSWCDLLGVSPVSSNNFVGLDARHFEEAFEILVRELAMRHNTPEARSHYIDIVNRLDFNVLDEEEI